MFYLACFLFFTAFLVSFYQDKRRLINAFLLLLSLIFAYFSLVVWTYQHLPDLHELLLAGLYLLLPGLSTIFAILLMINGVIILKKEGKRLSNMLSLGFGGGLLTYFLLFFAYTRTNPSLNSPIYRLFHYGIFFLSYLFVFLIFIFLAFLVYSLLYLNLPKKKDYDFIIIHGAGLLGGDRVTPLLAARIDKAIWAFEQAEKAGVKLIASGGQGADEKISEARAIANYLLDKGIDEASILLEDSSTTTYENLKFSKMLAEKEVANPKFLFVTNNYHVFRTSLFARRLKMVGEGLGAKTANYYVPSAFIREYVAILVKLKWLLIALVVAFILLALLTL